MSYIIQAMRGALASFRVTTKEELVGRDSSKAWSHFGTTCVFKARGFTFEELGHSRFASTIS